ncbi:MAG: tetratricopeptide repeat protein [Gemmatimonadetes bacterium]|nr:tetratricopeptide repeat protein [Gemmatimonadota bacterium]
MSRRLRAVVFTDIVGSTATMQADEAEARRLRSRHREAVDRATARWGGELVQYYGDGSLAVFDSAVAAVRSGVEIQRDVRQPPGVPLRIGIHVGDVVRDEDGVFGDAVNVAARLEALARPGAILVSAKVYDEIKNQGDLDAVSLGPVHLRNVASPTEVYAIADPALLVPGRDDLPGGSASPVGVAVLPFASLSADPEHAWFADGIAEELINALARIPGLKVTARTSSFAFRDRQADVRHIGRELGVGSVLEGSVRRAGSRVRLTAQLVDTTDGFQLFSEVYDRTLDDVFAVQDEVARTIVRELEPRLLETPAASPGRPITASTPWRGEAYELFLRARAEIARWTPDSMRQAIELCRRSIALDGDRAAPWSTQATAWVFLGGLGQMPRDEAYAEAERAIEAALELDPDDAVALTNRALRLIFADGNGDAALSLVDHALTVAPGLAFSHQSRAYVLLHERRFDAAIESAQAAVELDPLSPPLLNTLGTAFMAAGRLADARRVLERALAIAPQFRSAVQFLAWTYLSEGDLDRASELMDSLPEMAGFASASAGPRGYLYGLRGMPERAAEMMALVSERERSEPHLQLGIDRAIIHLGSGEVDAAIDLLGEAARSHRGTLFFVRWAAIWDPIRDHPRLQALLSG